MAVPKSKTVEELLRAHVLAQLKGGEAHVEFDRAVAKLPSNLRGAKPPGQPHTPWRLVEHMRITQNDILEFSKDARHKSPKWPDEYWPAGDAPPDEAAWERTIEEFKADRKELEAMVKDPANDLVAPLPHGKGQTLLREALLVVDHTSYHIGQLIIVRRLLGAWTDE